MFPETPYNKLCLKHFLCILALQNCFRFHITLYFFSKVWFIKKCCKLFQRSKTTFKVVKLPSFLMRHPVCSITSYIQIPRCVTSLITYRYIQTAGCIVSLLEVTGPRKSKYIISISFRRCEYKSTVIVIIYMLVIQQAWINGLTKWPNICLGNPWASRG